MKLSLVILVYNEITGLRSLLHRIPREAVDEIFAVDGGSTDGSIEYLKEKGIPVFPQDKRGRGEAFRVAFHKAKGDAVLFFSPDGNEDPEDIRKFRPLLELGNDLVIADRMGRGARNEEDHKFLRWRKWANLGFTVMANLSWNKGKWVNDTINGFRAITRTAWEKLQPDGDGYVIEYQTSIRAMKTGLRIAEFPTIESPRVDDKPGSPSVPTGVKFLKLYWAELRKR